MTKTYAFAEPNNLQTTDEPKMYEAKNLVKYSVKIAKHFPVGHYKAGELTNFKEKILAMEKIHTIRKNYAWWKKRFEKLNNEKAILIGDEWMGRPYYSGKNVLFLAPSPALQCLRFCSNGDILIDGELWFKAENMETGVRILAHNDGLTRNEFKHWFVDKKTGLLPVDQDLALIHFLKETKYN